MLKRRTARMVLHSITHVAISWCTLIFGVSSSFAQVPAPNHAPASIPAQPYLGRVTTDSLGRTVQYYVSERDADQPAPLVVYIQGSGARSHFVARPDGRIGGTSGHSTVRDVFAGLSRTVLVEKPGVAYLDNPASVTEASALFHHEHTLERWAAAIRAAISAACGEAGVDCTRGVLVIGHSEGGIVAARVAKKERLVSHVALLSGEGPSQLFSLLHLARSGVFFQDRGRTPVAREEYLLAAWDSIRAEPDRADKFFFGHPYPRWATFMSTSPIEELRQVVKPVFIAQGTSDEAVTPASADALFASLAGLGRAVCYLRAEGADHSFSQPGNDGWADVLQKVKVWFQSGEAPGALCTNARRDGN